MSPTRFHRRKIIIGEIKNIKWKEHTYRDQYTNVSRIPTLLVLVSALYQKYRTLSLYRT